MCQISNTVDDSNDDNFVCVSSTEMHNQRVYDMHCV